MNSLPPWLVDGYRQFKNGDYQAEVEKYQRLATEGQDSVSTDVVIGDPGHEITTLAERAGADLIVLNSHGRTGLKRLLIGSVAERVIRLAHCPVLVLRS